MNGIHNVGGATKHPQAPPNPHHHQLPQPHLQPSHSQPLPSSSLATSFQPLTQSHSESSLQSHEKRKKTKISITEILALEMDNAPKLPEDEEDDDLGANFPNNRRHSYAPRSRLKRYSFPIFQRRLSPYVRHIRELVSKNAFKQAKLWPRFHFTRSTRFSCFCSRGFYLVSARATP